MKNRSYDWEGEDFELDGNRLIEADHMSGDGVISFPKLSFRHVPLKPLADQIEKERRFINYLVGHGWEKQ